MSKEGLQPSPDANSVSEIQARVSRRQIAWHGPLLIVAGRSAMILAAQASIAAILLLRGEPQPWLAAAPWWTVYGTLVDVGCLAC